MRIPFTPPSDGQTHSYCVRCKLEALTLSSPGRYHCSKCNHSSDRAIIFDPKVVWWLDDTQEYWHETAGIFVRRKEKYLFFERVKTPYGLTIPAGHLDVGETSAEAAIRELQEETGLMANKLTLLATDNIEGDRCRRGADAHRWHVFATDASPRAEIRVNATEGQWPTWLTLHEALMHTLTPAVRYVIARYRNLIAAVK